MSILETKKAKKTPWHLWLIGIVGLLWNAMGALDYVMTETRNEAYMAQFSAEQLSFFYGLPSIIIALWAIAVWGGVLATILLLMRKSLSVWLFFISFVAMLITAIHNYGFANGFEVMGDPFSLIFTFVIFIVALGLYLYAKQMYQKGMLN